MEYNERRMLLGKVKNNLSTSEKREHDALLRKQGLEFRKFWVEVMKKHGHTNRVIAEAFDISESTVRNYLKES